jgi:hypothetical protein
MRTFIGEAFGTYDVECDCIAFSSTPDDIEYMPHCELSLRSDSINGTMTVMAMHVMCITIYIVVSYHAILYKAPSLFSFERGNVVYRHVCDFAAIICAITLTHRVWAHLYMNVSFRAYQEYNYYEFDVDFDIHNYVVRYACATYIHYMVIRVCSVGSRVEATEITIITLCAAYHISVAEAIYYIVVPKAVTELRLIVQIFGAKWRYGLYGG